MVRMAVVLGMAVFACSIGAAQDAGGGSRALIVYFSKTGTTQGVAEEIHSQVGGDIFQITTVRQYPDDYHQTSEIAKVEQNSNERPTLHAYVENMEQYDIIFVGFPNWWGSMPMAMYTFLEHYDLSGKTIIPFMTHGGGGVQRCEQDIKRVCSTSTVMPILVLGGSQARNAKEHVTTWLRTIPSVQ